LEFATAKKKRIQSWWKEEHLTADLNCFTVVAAIEACPQIRRMQRWAGRAYPKTTSSLLDLMVVAATIAS